MYNPIIPMQNIIIPPTNQMELIIDNQPNWKLIPYKCKNKNTSKLNNAENEIIKPKIPMKTSGFYENDTIAFIPLINLFESV